MFRQGDVLLIPREPLSDEQRRWCRPVARDRDRIVLAEGEATGHAHAVSSHRAELWDFAGSRILEVEEPVVLSHEEHAPIAVDPGLYRVVVQREHDYTQGRSSATWRPVAD